MPDTQAIVPAHELAATNEARYPNESAEYRRARNELLVEEIELRRHLERVAAQRRALPAGGELPQDFQLASETGPIRFSSLFGDKDTLLVYSMMYGPQRKTVTTRGECDEPAAGAVRVADGALYLPDQA